MKLKKYQEFNESLLTSFVNTFDSLADKLLNYLKSKKEQAANKITDKSVDIIRQIDTKDSDTSVTKLLALISKIKELQRTQDSRTIEDTLAKLEELQDDLK